MTNREFINQLSNLDLANCIIYDDFLNAVCLESQENNQFCANKECAKCFALWLEKPVGTIVNYKFQNIEGN